MAIFKGIAFPFRRGRGGLPARAEDEESIRDSIRQIVLTAKGERVMRPHIGCSVHDMLFEPLNPALEDALVLEVRAAIATQEPRIVVTDVVVLPNENGSEEENGISLEIRYVIPALRRESSVHIAFGERAPR